MIIQNYDHFTISPKCWDTLGEHDIGELNDKDIEEVKNNIDEKDMTNAVICPVCKDVLKKQTQLNELTCHKCENKVCFHCGKLAEEGHYKKGG